MRIGIGMDDTICRTTEIVHEKMEEYARDKNIEVLEVMNSELERMKFFDKYISQIYENAVIKRNAKDVIRRLKHKGNEIFIITGRSNSDYEGVTNVANVIEEWLKKNDIEVDGIFSSAFSEDIASICKREKIDLMIDDNPYIYKMITSHGGRCLLFDDREKYDLKENYVTNWLQVEDYINRFRG